MFAGKSVLGREFSVEDLRGQLLREVRREDRSEGKRGGRREEQVD